MADTYSCSSRWLLPVGILSRLEKCPASNGDNFMSKKTLAQAIRLGRERRDESLTQSACAMDMSVSYLQCLEAGNKKNPTLKILCVILPYFGIDFDELLAPRND